MGEIFGAEHANTTALQVVLCPEVDFAMPGYYTICLIIATLLRLIILAKITQILPKFTRSPRLATTPATSIIAPSLSIHATRYEHLRGAARATASPTTFGRSAKSPWASHARAEAQAASASASGSGGKKAVLIGLNYSRCGKSLQKGHHLQYAVRDARPFLDSLMKHRYLSKEIEVLTDEDDQPFPSHKYPIECIDWLVRDVSDGDKLLFMFSGHCEPPKLGKPEPYLTAADLMGIPQSTFQERLAKEVPAGAELTIVLDCCSAVSMVEYGSEMTQTTESETLSKLGNPDTPSARKFPLSGSLYGVSTIEQKISPVGTSVAPRPNRGGVAAPPPSQAFTFGPSTSSSLHHSRGVVAAPLPLAIMPNHDQEPAPSLVGSSSVANLPTGLNIGCGQQLVVEGRPVRHFEERKNNCVPTSGNMICWAGAGELGKAFEATGGVENSIITNSIRSVLENMEKTMTQRDIWHSVVGAVDKENNLRKERDARKCTTKIAPHLRVQCAQLLVSQQEALNTPSIILNQAVF